MAFLLLSLFAYLYYLEAQKPGRRRDSAFACCFFPCPSGESIRSILPPLLFLYDLCFSEEAIGEGQDKLPSRPGHLLFSVGGLDAMGDAWRITGLSVSTFLAMINVFVEYIVYLIVPVYLTISTDRQQNHF
jgi:hypothetical protein